VTFLPDFSTISTHLNAVEYSEKRLDFIGDLRARKQSRPVKQCLSVLRHERTDPKNVKNQSRDSNFRFCRYSEYERIRKSRFGFGAGRLRDRNLQVSRPQS